jgi:hypothetical protein
LRGLFLAATAAALGDKISRRQAQASIGGGAWWRREYLWYERHICAAHASVSASDAAISRSPSSMARGALQHQHRYRELAQ